MLSPLKLNARSNGSLGNFSRIYSNVSVGNDFLVISPSYAQDCFFKFVTKRAIRCRLQRGAVGNVEVCPSCQSKT